MLARTCKGLTEPGLNRAYSEITILGNDEPRGFTTWWAKFGKSAFRVKAISYNCPENDQGRTLTERENSKLHSFTQVETLRLTGAHLDLAPEFTILQNVCSLSLDNCSMTTGKFVGYLRSFPQLKFLSISAPAFTDEFEHMDPTSLPNHGGLLKRHVALQLKFIPLAASTWLLYALTYVPFAFTTIHIHSSPSLVFCQIFPVFLGRTKETVTEIGIDGESPLRHTRPFVD